MLGRHSECAHLQVLQHRHARKYPPSLRHMRDAAPRDFERRKLRDVLTLELDGSGRRRTWPQIVISSVVFPAPFAPITQAIWLVATSRSIPLSTSMRP